MIYILGGLNQYVKKERIFIISKNSRLLIKLKKDNGKLLQRTNQIRNITRVVLILIILPILTVAILWICWSSCLLKEMFWLKSLRLNIFNEIFYQECITFYLILESCLSAWQARLGVLDSWNVRFVASGNTDCVYPFLKSNYIFTSKLQKR